MGCVNTVVSPPTSKISRLQDRDAWHLLLRWQCGTVPACQDGRPSIRRLKAYRAWPNLETGEALVIAPSLFVFFRILVTQKRSSDYGSHRGVDRADREPFTRNLDAASSYPPRKGYTRIVVTDA